MQLTLMRRADTAGSGRGGDVGLTVEGEQQVAEAASELAAHGPEVIVTSPMARAVATAERLAKHLDVPVLTQAGLEERSFGDWGSWVWPQIAAELDPLSLEERYTFRPPNGESWEDMDQRLATAAAAMAELPHDRVLAVTHWGPIRALLPLLTNTPKESTLQLVVHNAERFALVLP